MIELVGLSLDKKTHDLHFDSVGNLVLARNKAAIEQHAIQRVSTFEGEWFLDTTAGLPWFQQIFGRRYDATLAEAIVKGEIAETFGVTEITSFSMSYDNPSRQLKFRDLGVDTIYDEEV